MYMLVVLAGWAESSSDTMRVTYVAVLLGYHLQKGDEDLEDICFRILMFAPRIY